MSYNIALLSQVDREKIKIDLEAARVAFRKRHGLTIDTSTQPRSKQLQDKFFQRVIHYQDISKKLSHSSSRIKK